MHIYTQHFNLNKLPFENVPDPLFFYNSGDHARIRKQISGSLQSGRGLIVVTGPIGSGKTTLSQMIKADFPEDIKLIWMAEPPASSGDLYLYLAQELGLQPPSSEKTFVMRDIRNALLKINSEGEKCLVIIDESHLMSDDVLNGIRLLNNLEEGSVKLIQLLLLGQEELMEKINRPAMEPFKQRIAALETLGRMNVEAVRNYISHRLKIAGGTPDLISDTGWEAISIAFHTGGTPRTINSLCDRSFSVAFERNKPVVDAHHVYEATQRLGLRTDVFHYIISLKSKERKSQEIQVTADQTVPQTPEAPPAETAASEAPLFETPASIKEPFSSPMGRKTRPAVNVKVDEASLNPGINVDATDSSYEDIANVIRAKYNQKSLQIPAMLLSMSLVMFVMSLLFFCHQTDSVGFIGCMMDLFSF
ncbi:ExeA family protein [Nitrosomonas sp. Nm166]|uniref:ExeA family protein n=1 Tax=Nitrosomonas sp. Nm166 TaxID=1881054 RepID=UPI0008E00A8C|nr:AAA family ATPase [Nitrosomonas sp. Nm166]SFE27999.1 general secretion pathway protein A [Nitrosomonas sp. Nm166]